MKSKKPKKIKKIMWAIKFNNSISPILYWTRKEAKRKSDYFNGRYATATEKESKAIKVKVEEV